MVFTESWAMQSPESLDFESFVQELHKGGDPGQYILHGVLVVILKGECDESNLHQFFAVDHYLFFFVRIGFTVGCFGR